MEYHVVYHSNHGVGTAKNHHKRKRYEKAAPQIDGILVLHKAVSEFSFDQENINQQANPMIATLYSIKRSEANCDDSESSSSDNPGVWKKAFDDNDSEDELDEGSKKRSWKDRKKFASRPKGKRMSKSSKKMKTNTLSRNDNHQTFKTVVYSGNITQEQVGRSTNSSVSDSKISGFVSVDDTVILGPFTVHIVGPVAMSAGANATNRCSNDENNAGNALGAAYRNNISHPPSAIDIPKSSSINQQNIRSCHSMVPIRRIVSVPLQSKHNIKKTGISTNPPKQNSTSGISIVASDAQYHDRPIHPNTIARKATPAVSKKFETKALILASSSSSGHPVLQKSTALPMKSLHQPRMLPKNSHSCISNDTKVLPHIPLPASIRTVLRPHQVEGVNFMWRTLNEKKGCILGDEMGLGVCSGLTIFLVHPAQLM
jgi:hypothetical protein